jgi:hypothetical protein
MEQEPVANGLADPGSLLGMLQRGRGAGYLAAVQSPREMVWAMLLHCLKHDPRLDTDVEDRAEYYGWLVLATEMDLSPLVKWLRDNNTLSETDRWKLRLGLETVGHLAQRGRRPQAVDILRDYVSWGRDWVDAMKMLSTMDPPTTGLDALLRDRIKSDPAALDQLRDEIPYIHTWWPVEPVDEGVPGRGLGPTYEPWRSLCEQDQGLRDLFVAISQAHGEDSDGAPGADVRQLSLAEMFASVAESNVWKMARAIVERVSEDDETFLLQHVAAQDNHQAILAFKGLGVLRTARAFEAVKTFLESSDRADSRVRAKAIDAFGRMPASLALDTARLWFLRDEWYLHLAAGHVLAKHATWDDIAMLVDLLHRPETLRRDDSRLSSVLDALSLFHGYGFIPELEQVFVETGHCFDRFRAAKAMAVTAPEDFVAQYALECLWDCHWEARGLGCDTVSLSLPGALDRLREIAADQGEPQDVRETARERLKEF